jgi:hypothetical protein
MNHENSVTIPTVDQKINVAKLSSGKIYEFKVDQYVPWMKELLEELNEDVKVGFISPSSQGSISCEGSYYKKVRPEYGEYAVLKGHLLAKFYTNCVITGKVMLDEVDVEFEACFLGHSFKNNPDYKDEIEFYIDNSTMDLFFLNNNLLDLKEVLHEYLYLNKDPYPKLDKKETKEQESEN